MTFWLFHVGVVCLRSGPWDHDWW